MSKNWGKIFVATRYQPNLPAWSCESLIGLAQFGLHNASAELVDYVAALERTLAEHAIDRPAIARPDRYLRRGDLRDFVYSKTMHKAANMLVRRALKTDCDSICFIDSDAVFGTDALEELRSDPEGWEYDVLQAFTVKRGWPPEPMLLVEQPDQPTYQPQARKGVHFTSQLPIDDNLIYPTKDEHYRIAVSLHFTLIRLDLFRRMIENDDPDSTYFFEYARDNGEDINFSMKANDLGARLGMTTRLKVGHVSEVISGWDSMVDYYSRKFDLESGAAVASLDRYREHFKQVVSLSELVAEFTGESVESVYQRAIVGASPVADAWNKAAPKSVEEVERFYSGARVYLYDLILWNTSPTFQRLLKSLSYAKEGERVLDYGGGLGTVTEYLASRGCSVHYYDLKGVIRDFATWRFAKLPDHLSDRIGVVDRWPIDYYDRVVAIDVVEHIHPEIVAEQLDGLILALRAGGLLFAHNSFGDDKTRFTYPQHYDNAQAWRDAIKRHSLEEVDQFTWRKPGQGARLEDVDLFLLSDAIQGISQ